MSYNINKFLIATVICTATLPTTAGATPVESDDQLAADSVRRLNEVAVTALKQSAEMRFQPQAATIIGERRIERLGIAAIKGVSEIAPNFYIPDYGSRMTSSIYVRGIGSRMDQPVVGLNVDNVSFLDKDAYDFDAFCAECAL